MIVVLSIVDSGIFKTLMTHFYVLFLLRETKTETFVLKIEGFVVILMIVMLAR